MSYKSKLTIFGFPFFHLSTAPAETAVGFIAIGQQAYGIIAIGQFGVGVLFGVGQFMAGIFTLAQFSLGIVVSVGQFAAGTFSIGMFAFGYEGLHMIGYHAVERNFFAELVTDWEATEFTAIYLLLLLAGILIVYALSNVAIRLARFVSRTFFSRARNNDDTERQVPGSESSPDGKLSKRTRLVLFILAFIAIYELLHVHDIDRILDAGTRNRVTDSGAPAHGEVLSVKDTGISFFGSTVYIVIATVRPIDGEIEPFETEFVLITSDPSRSYRGADIPLRYDPKRPRDVAFDPDR
jgi:hypothetical protein